MDLYSVIPSEVPKNNGASFAASTPRVMPAAPGDHLNFAISVPDKNRVDPSGKFGSRPVSTGSVAGLIVSILDNLTYRLAGSTVARKPAATMITTGRDFASIDLDRLIDSRSAD
ncbi:MAG TPA: hypothetical protein VFK04_14555 [Gemmatimonadaceae bacterium]|nr:hypothetical protein [Gemmatimonadaceae bacterium]